jgi:hypothetical protein
LAPRFLIGCPAALVVLSQLKVKALAVHADGDVPDAGPGVEQGAERVERAVVRRQEHPAKPTAARSSPPWSGLNPTSPANRCRIVGTAGRLADGTLVGL